MVGPWRGIEQGPACGLNLLVEMAERALSPAVNDPGTAIAAMGSQSRLMVAGLTEAPAPDALLGGVPVAEHCPEGLVLRRSARRGSNRQPCRLLVGDAPHPEAPPREQVRLSVAGLAMPAVWARSPTRSGIRPAALRADVGRDRQCPPGWASGPFQPSSRALRTAAGICSRAASRWSLHDPGSRLPRLTAAMQSFTAAVAAGATVASQGPQRQHHLPGGTAIYPLVRECQAGDMEARLLQPLAVARWAAHRAGRHGGDAAAVDGDPRLTAALSCLPPQIGGHGAAGH